MILLQHKLGDIVYMKGDKADTFIFILDGQLEVFDYKKKAGTNQYTPKFVRNLKSGEAIGINVLMSDVKARQLSAKVVSQQCFCLIIRKSDFNKVTQSNL